MTALGIDLGGTKLSFAVFSQQGDIFYKQTTAIEKRTGNAVGDLLVEETKKIISSHKITSIGIAVPGIYHNRTGTVWAPNIKEWEDYPLLQQMKDEINIPVLSTVTGRAISWENHGREMQKAAVTPSILLLVQVLVRVF